MTGPPFAGVLRRVCQVLRPEGSEEDDSRLLQRFVAQRDEAAFAALLQRHGPMVLGVCRQVLRDTHDAEDAFQATFLVLARKAPAIRRRELLPAWLHRVAFNIARTARTGTVQRRAHERQAVLMSGARPVDEVTLHDWQSILHGEVDRLPPKYRVPVILCYFEGKTHDEAARQLAWPLGTVKGRLARARDLLRARLARRGLVLTAAGTAAALAQGASAVAVPPALLAPTLSAAVSFAAGGSVPAASASAAALALAKGAVQAMTGTKATQLVALLLAVGVIASLVAATAPQTQRADAAPPSEQAVARLQRTDRHGDPLPPGAIARLGTVRFRHGKALQAIAFSPDGKTIASAGHGGSLVLHDAATGKTLHSFRGKAAYTYPHPVAFAPDGKTLAAGVDRPLGTVWVWEVATGKLVRELQLAGKPVYSLSFSKDGGMLVGGGEHMVHVWDVRVGKEISRIPPPPGTHFDSQGVALAYDGKTLVTGVVDKKEIISFCLWETVSGRKLHQWQAHPNEEGIHALALSPDGKRLACALGYGDGDKEPYRLRVWAVPTGELQLDLPGVFHSLRFSPCGKILAAGATGSVFLLATDTGKEIRRIPTGWIPSVPMDFRPDGKVLALGALWTVTLWDVTTGERLGPRLDGHERVVENVMFLPDGKTLASTSEDAVHFWQARTGRRIGRFVGLEANLNHQAISPDGKIRAVAGWNKAAGYGIGLWDTGTGKKRCELEPAPKSWPRDLVFSPDGKMLGEASWDDTIRLWDVVTGTSNRQFATQKPHAASLAFSPDGKTLAVGDGDLRDHPGAPMVRLLDSVTGRELRKPFELPCAARDPDRFLGVHRVGRVAFSADGKVLAAATTSGGPSGTDHTIQVWEVITGKVLCRLKEVPVRPGEQSCRFALSPDGKSLLTPGDPPLLWEVTTGKLRGQIRGHAAWVGAVAFSPDGRLLATGSQDTTVLVWDVLKLNSE